MFPYPFHTLKSVSLSLPLPPLVVAAAAPPIAAEGLSFLLRLSPRLSLRRSSLHPGLWSLLAASSLASPGLAAACICYGGIDEIYCRSEKICFGFSDAKPRRPAQPDRHANRRHKRTVMGQTFPLSVWFGLGRLLPNPTGPARRPALAIPICVVQNSIFIPLTATPLSKVSIARAQFNNFIITPKFLTLSLSSVASSSSPSVNRAGWFLGLADNNKKMLKLPEIVKAGDPVLHELTQEVDPNEIRSERVQKVIDDMIRVMRKAPGVGLAAPQIGIPLRIIVLEDTKEYISYASKEEIKAQDRLPFDLLVILNPKLEKKSERTALFFEGCLSVDGFRAVVERYLDVEVTGLDRNGEPIKITASGWQARILQHECDHLDGTLYVDKMVPRTFRNVENLDLPLAQGCPKLGPR